MRSASRLWVPLQLAGASGLGLSAASLTLAAQSPVPMLLAVAGGSAAYVFALWRARSALVALAGAPLATVAGIVNLGPAITDLHHPESLYTFVPASLGIVGATTVVLGSAGLLLGLGDSAARRVGFAGVEVLVFALVIAFTAPRAVDDSLAQPGDMRVAAARLQFEFPEGVLVRREGSEVTLHLDNADRLRHTFAIPALDLVEEMPASTARRVTVAIPAGTFEVICTVLGHEAMVGTLVVP